MSWLWLLLVPWAIVWLHQTRKLQRLHREEEIDERTTRK